MLFNPMDLFNPFAPTDIDRAYKVSNDMLTSQIFTGGAGEIQLLYVPRRNPTSRKLEWDESSLAGKLHFSSGENEFDIMCARHYKDYVTGFGVTGYIKDAAWRLDGTWTFLNGQTSGGGFYSVVANIDYSWNWFGRNFYGMLEFYSNGVGNNNYLKALLDPDISRRIERGELFTLGNHYMAGEIQIELHPLFKVNVTVINNLYDPSGTIQPRAVWDVKDNLQIMIGGNIFYGEKNSEFGGIRIPGTGLSLKSSNSLFIRMSYFF